MRRMLILFGLLTVVVLAALGASDPLDPADAPVAVRRAVFRAEQAARDGDLVEAQRVLADALAAGGDRDHPAVRFRLAAYQLELEQPAAALENLRVASEQAPTSMPVWRELARAAYETGQYGESAAAFASAYENRGENTAVGPELLYYSGVAWILADQPDRAVDVLAPLVDTVPDTVPFDWVQALVSAATSADQPARAEAGVQRLLSEYADDSESWRLASQLAQFADDIPLAAVRLQVAAWLDGLSATEKRRLAELHAAAGVPRQAARVYAELWDGGRGDRDLAGVLATSWLQAHEPDSARVVLETSLTTEPAAGMYLMLGDLEYGAERWEAAAVAYGQAGELAPDRGRAWLMLAAVEVKQDRPDLAVDHLQRAANDPAVAEQAQRLLDQIERRRR